MATASAGNFADGPHSVMIPRKKKKARQSKKTPQASKEPEKTISFRNYALSDAPAPPEDAPAKLSTAKQVCARTLTSLPCTSSVSTSPSRCTLQRCASHVHARARPRNTRANCLFLRWGKVEAQIERELHQSMVTSKDAAVSITAKSADWDLKRDVADKLKKLDRLTLRAIRDIVQERITKEIQEAGGSSSSSSDSSSSGSDSSSGSGSDDSSSDSDSDNDGS
jgi:hypothetical protein